MLTPHGNGLRALPARQPNGIAPCDLTNECLELWLHILGQQIEAACLNLSNKNQSISTRKGVSLPFCLRGGETRTRSREKLTKAMGIHGTQYSWCALPLGIGPHPPLTTDHSRTIDCEACGGSCNDGYVVLQVVHPCADPPLPFGHCVPSQHPCTKNHRVGLKCVESFAVNNNTLSPQVTNYSRKVATRSV